MAEPVNQLLEVSTSAVFYASCCKLMKITSVVAGNSKHLSVFSMVVTVTGMRRHRKCGFAP